MIDHTIRFELFSISNGMLKAAMVAVCMSFLPAPSFAQSANDDSDLFPEDEQYLRLGDSDRNITLSPFMQYDGGYSDVSDNGQDTDTKLRLARLYVFGAFGDFGGTFAYEFDNDAFPVRYAFVTYNPSNELTIKVGQQDQPFSLQDMSGSRFLPFAEAGQNAALTPGDDVGVTAFYGGDAFSIAAGVFGGDVNTGISDEGVSFSGRATWAPIYQESRIDRGGDATSQGSGTQRVDSLLHLGFGLSTTFDQEQSISFAGTPNSSLVSASIATSPTFSDTDNITRVNLEMSRQTGSFSLQGELTGIYADAPQANGGYGHGGYVYTSYFLTGERRGYDRSSGTFGRVIPKNPIDSGGFGAVEIGARLDYLDLTDLGPDGGAQFGVSAVTNVYLTKRLTLTADYTYTKGTAGPADGIAVNAITGRIQFAY